MVLHSTYSYVKCPLKILGIYGGDAPKTSIFRPLYIYPQQTDRNI